MAGFAAFFLPLVLGQVGFVASSNGDCPDAARVEQRVRGILGLQADEMIDERATLLREGETLHIIVKRPDGSVLGERQLGTAATCEELEVLASVVLASWISDVHPEFVAALPPAPSRGAMPGEEPAAPAPVAGPSSGKEPARASAPEQRKSAVTAPPPARSQRWRWEVAGALGAGFSGHGVSGLLVPAIGWAPERSGLGLLAAFHFTTPQTEPLSMGSVRYFRWPLVAGLAWRVSVGGPLLDLHAGAALGWLHAKGIGFHPSSTRNVPRGGGQLGIRASYGERLRGFIDLSGVLWGKTEAVVERGNELTALPLPMVELYATAGATWAP